MSKDNKVNVSGKKVIVGLTGRMDSAVAAFLLKKQGFQVIGLSMVNINQGIVSDPQYLPKCHIVDLDRVRSFCESINIPFYATDSKPQFEMEVLDRLITNKLTGKANSSCFNCTRMRIHVLYEKMKQLKADMFSTGHYCKVYKNFSSDEYFIHSNNDPKSDQSYLLAGLEKEYLKHLVLPLGELRKEEVKKIAKNFGLNTDESIEQEGFCFREKEASEKILKTTLPKSLIKEGQFVNIENDTVVGEHDGMIYHYVTEADFPIRGAASLDKGLEIVGYSFQTGSINVGKAKRLTFGGTQVVNLMMSGALDRKKPLSCYIKFKYENKFTKAVLYFKNNKTAYLEFEHDIYPLIEGELMAIYDSNGRNSKIIGLGTVGSRGKFKLVDRVAEYRPKVDEEEYGKVNYVSQFKF
jgi:tRNA-specific 2-thiouridylase